MNKKISFLIADDDNNVIASLRATISQAFSDIIIHSALDGSQAWEMFQIHQPMIVILDLIMPNLTGLHILKKIREAEENFKTYVIIITGHTEKSQRQMVLDEGADDYIIKPFSFDELSAKLAAAYRIADMQVKMNEENQLLMDLADVLRKNLNDVTKLAVKFCEARIPSSVDTLKKVAEASLWIAKKLGDVQEENFGEIEIAALLAYSGKTFLPDNLINRPVMVNGNPSDNLMYQVPVYAKEIVSSIEQFHEVSGILYSLYENFDGSGMPDRLQSWQIPIGARIIRAVLDYEEMMSGNKAGHKSILEKMFVESKRLYDHRIVILLEQYIATFGLGDSDVKERGINLDDLNSGMLLTRDIFTNSGMKVMSSGSILNAGIIEKLRLINTSDPILGSVFIKEQV